MNPYKFKKIAITGGIGSGKSQLAKRIEYLRSNYIPIKDKIHILSLDFSAKIVLNKYKSNYIWNFGEDFYNLDGTANKKFIMDILKDPDSHKKMDFVTANLMIAYLESFYTDYVKEGDIVFLETATLFETGMDTYVDDIILVISDENIRRERVKTRKTMSEDDINFIMSIQTTSEEIRNKCGYIIENNDTLEEFNKNIDSLIKKIIMEK